MLRYREEALGLVILFVDMEIGNELYRFATDGKRIRMKNIKH